LTSEVSPEVVEITERVQGYANKCTTNELYDFGKMLLLEQVDRAHWIDSKAISIGGFCGAAVALLISTSSGWKADLAGKPFLHIAAFIGIVCIVIAGGLAFIALYNRKFSWIDEKDEWFKSDYLEFPDFLKRSYVLTMYQSARSHSKRNAEKSFYLTASQLILLIGGAALSVVLLITLWPF
jgi:hypothetical protein